MLGGARAVARCDALGVAPYSDMADGLYRGYLTPAYAKAQRAVADWMVEAGMTVRLDPAVNLIGVYPGTGDGPPLVIGSHLDSVRDGGRYDGPLGILLGIECVAALHAGGRRLPFAIHIYAFGDEEGSRFPAAMLTSRAVAGTLDPAMLDVADAEGIMLGAALRRHHQHSHLHLHLHLHHPEQQQKRHPSESWDLANGGTQPQEIPAFAGMTSEAQVTFEAGMTFTAAKLPAALAYLEAHIEQGPALEAEGLPVGIVTAIAAQRRHALTVTGRAGHAGTTAMGLRRDALAAAAQMIGEAEAIARIGPPDLVATVGRLAVAPGAANVVPGRADFTLDVRAGTDQVRDEAASAILAACARIAQERGVALAVETLQDLPASPCDPQLSDLLALAVGAQGIAPHRLVSGAGHDAMVMAALCPTAMLFVRCRDGISHHPAEHVEPADAEVALAVMRGFIDRLGELHG